MQNRKPFVLSLPFSILSVLFSGICFFFGFSLTGNLGWLMWIAPIPILYISWHTKPARAFLIAFLAYLIGRISWLPYLLSLLPIPLVILFTIVLPLIFALIVVGARKIVLVSQHWISALAFPVFFTAFEYILFNVSRDGTAASIAYTQSNYLPVIQVASITGILGISFLISFVPSAIALCWYFKQDKKIVFILTGLLIIMVSDLFIYGWIRLMEPETGNPQSIGMVAINESAYKGVYQHDPVKEMRLTDLYVQEIPKLADRGAKVILIPEKAVIVNDSSVDSVLTAFKQLAINHKVQIIIGGTRNHEGYYLNTAWFISDKGNILADYQKVNLFEGEVMDGCKPGNKIAVFDQDSIRIGIAICKDMDFQQFILGYSKKSPAILYVPAWDFVTDGWMHGRMAILRSVEGGFALARNAREGRLTLSDWRGKILYEANSESGNTTTLVGKLSLESHPTTYARTGDWFGTVNAFAALGLLVYMFKNRRKKSSPERG